MSDLGEHFYVYNDPAVRDFAKSLRSGKAWEAGEVLGPVKAVRTDAKDYLTVQCGPSNSDHIRLESDFVYVNHSCEPNVAFEVSSEDQADWLVRALKPIKADEELTFFYPSTEWELDQPFECRCRTPSCLKIVRGAKFLSPKEIESRGYVSPWIVQLSREELAETLGRA